MKPVIEGNTRLVSNAIIPVTGGTDTPVVDEVETVDETLEGGVVAEENQIEATLTKPAPDEVAQQNTDLLQRIKDLEKQREIDVGKVKSTYQTREHEVLKEKSILEQKLEKLLQSTMTDEDRVTYQQEKLLEDLNKANEKVQELTQKDQLNQQLAVWRNTFADLGIDPSALDETGGIGSVVGSGLAAIKAKLAEKTKSVKTKPTKEGAEVPEVASTTTGKLPNVTTLTQAIKHFAEGDAEKFWRMAESGNTNVLRVLNEIED